VPGIQSDVSAIIRGTAAQHRITAPLDAWLQDLLATLTPQER
jgi:hypothetical protein